jgi:outer membrane protein OmpA-like peptidoglycan-associated protein
VPAFFRTVPLRTAVLIGACALSQPRSGACSSSTEALYLDWFKSYAATSSAVDPALDPQKTESEPHMSGPPAVNRLTPDEIAPPPFLRHPILFDRNSLNLNAAGNDALRRAATWLKAHAGSRILIVGSCDKSGSESCTHTLAEARGNVVRKFLENCGIGGDQVVGVKGWDNPDHDCRSGDVKCQQLSRSAQLFLAASGPPI